MCQRPAVYPAEIAAAALTQRVGGVAVRASSTALGSPLFANECLNGNGALGTTAQTTLAQLTSATYGDGVSGGAGGGGGGGGGGRGGGGTGGYYYEGYGRKEDGSVRARRRASFGAERADALIRGLERRFVEGVGAVFASSSSEWNGLTASLREMLQAPGEAAAAAAAVVAEVGGGSGGGADGAKDRGETAVVDEAGGAGDEEGPDRRLRRTRGRDCAGASGVGGGGGGGGGGGATSLEAGAAVEYRASCSAPAIGNPNPDLLGRDSGAAATVTGSGRLSSPADRKVEDGAAMVDMEVEERREREVICADVEATLQQQQEVGGRATAGGLPPFSKDASGNGGRSNLDQTNNACGPVCPATTPEASSQSHMSSLESSLSNGSQYRGMEATGSGAVISTEVPFEKGTRKDDMLSRLDGTVSTTSCLNAQMIGCSDGAAVSNGNWRMPLTAMAPFSTYGSSYYTAATAFPTYGGLNGNSMPLRNTTQIQSKAEETGVPVMGLPARPLCSDPDASVSWIPQRISLLQNGFASSTTHDLPNMAGRGTVPVKGFSEELGNLAICGNAGAAGMSLPMVAQRGPRYCMDGSNDIQSLPHGCTAMGACAQDMMGYAHTDGNASSDIEDVVIDEKKRRRMMSNRDSARRSRQRRQERLELLERQAALLRVENSKLRSRTMNVTDQMLRYEEENKNLIEELTSLKEEVASLRRGGSGALTGSGTANSSDAGCESSGADSEQCETKEKFAPGCSEDVEVDGKGVMIHATSPQNRQQAKRMHNGVEKDVASGLDAQRGLGATTANDESCTGIEEIGSNKKEEDPLAKWSQDETKNRTACSYNDDTVPARGHNAEGEAAGIHTNVTSCTCRDHSVGSSSPDELSLDDTKMLVMHEEMLGTAREVMKEGESARKEEEGGITMGDVRCDGHNQTGYRSDCLFGYGMPNTISSSVTPCNFDGQVSDAAMIGSGNWTLEELLSFNFE